MHMTNLNHSLHFKISMNVKETWISAKLMHHVEIQKDRIIVLVIVDMMAMVSIVQVFS